MDTLMEEDVDQQPTAAEATAAKETSEGAGLKDEKADEFYAGSQVKIEPVPAKTSAKIS